MTNIVEQLENEQIEGKKIPSFKPGDTVVVQVRVVEGERERLQAFEGIVIAKRNRGLNSSFTVRKISHGEGVERVFQTYSPLISNIKVKRRGHVRRAKLYYLRELRGRSARIKERLLTKGNRHKLEAIEKEDEVLQTGEDVAVVEEKPTQDVSEAPTEKANEAPAAEKETTTDKPQE